VASDTGPLPLNASDAVEADTPALAATAASVGLGASRSVMSLLLSGWPAEFPDGDLAPRVLMPNCAAHPNSEQLDPRRLIR
jgi:hypothetical protein